MQTINHFLNNKLFARKSTSSFILSDATRQHPPTTPTGTKLPQDMWFQILSYLDPHSLTQLGMSCCYFYCHSENSSVWASIIGIPRTAQLNLPASFKSWQSYGYLLSITSWKYLQEHVQIHRDPSMRCLPATKGPFVKAMLFGNGGCGKTALIKKFTQGSFQNDYTHHKYSIGNYYLEVSIPTPYRSGNPENLRTSPSNLPSSTPSPSSSQQTKLELVIRDAGSWEEDMRYSEDCYMSEIHILCYDINDPSSLPYLETVLAGRKKYNPKAPGIFLGLKSELERKVPFASALEYANTNNLLYLEVSTHTNTNVELPFLFAASVGMQMKSFPKQTAKFLNAIWH